MLQCRRNYKAASSLCWSCENNRGASKETTAEQLGLQYESTKKGWMTSTLLLRWLSQLNEQMRIAGRHIFLLVDNVSSHQMDELLSNVKLQMLPPNTTDFLQPQDAGITSSFEAQIAKIQHRHIVDRFDDLLERLPAIPEGYKDKEIGSLFNVDVLSTMQ
uniref:PREDICTED: similar to tigger transposable element derived 4 putative n=1 Tax=Albugo laibachii Nc14 TaxID=890382 RepID=F0WUU9_9STRA|nr:PREDICTED: similar to tigger transposable element derived 4 putative [Albugo laibachii Nc14]|eukprot:CCA25185.1 PREDICTED: similar to tigger transposable element derived 4 putative [Albugo laibachii Nc14]